MSNKVVSQLAGIAFTQVNSTLKKSLDSTFAIATMIAYNDQSEAPVGKQALYKAVSEKLGTNKTRFYNYSKYANKLVHFHLVEILSCFKSVTHTETGDPRNVEPTAQDFFIAVRDHFRAMYPSWTEMTDLLDGKKDKVKLTSTEKANQSIQRLFTAINKLDSAVLLHKIAELAVAREAALVPCELDANINDHAALVSEHLKRAHSIMGDILATYPAQATPEGLEIEEPEEISLAA
jgi:hypothetical protein